MKIKGIDENQLQGIIYQFNRENMDNGRLGSIKPDFRGIRRKGNFLIVHLVMEGKPKKYYRVHPSGRKSAHLCWHGFRDLMDLIFDMNENAIIITSMARYNGIDDFNEKYHDTKYNHVGSMVNPSFYGYSCGCEER